MHDLASLPSVGSLYRRKDFKELNYQPPVPPSELVRRGREKVAAAAANHSNDEELAQALLAETGGLRPELAMWQKRLMTLRALSNVLACDQLNGDIVSDLSAIVDFVERYHEQG